MNCRIIFAVVLLQWIFGPVLLAQETFLKTYGSAQSEYGNSVFATQDSGYIISAILPLGASDIQSILLKINRKGEELFVHSYDYKTFMTPVSAIESATGEIYLLCSAWDNFSPGDFSSILIKCDDEGRIQWSREVSFSGSLRSADILVQSNQIFVLSEYNYNNGAYPGILLSTFDTSGSFVQSYRYSSSRGLKPVKCSIDESGQTGILARSNEFGSGAPSFDNNVFLLLDSTGSIITSKVWGTFYDDEAEALFYRNGKWFVSGRSYFINSSYDIFISTLNTQGEHLQTNFYNGGTFEGEASRDLFVTESLETAICGDAGTFDERNIIFMLADSSGNLLSSLQYPISPLFTNYAFSICRSADKGYAITGDLRPPAYFRDAFIMKTDSTGIIPCSTQVFSMQRRTETIDTLTVNLNYDSVSPIIQAALVQTGVAPYPEKNICSSIPAIADFIFSADTLCPDPCYSFFSTSLNDPHTLEWNFPGGIPTFFSGEIPPLVCYPTAGSYNVILKAINGDGFNEKIISLTVPDFPCDTIFIPNVITPDADGKNDSFRISGANGLFKLKIFNRWGKLIFESDNSKNTWDAQDVSAGVYYYLLQAEVNGELHDFRGTLSVIRN
ncbi:MAG: hypothetical protein DWQ44_13165 [Bacteroidetes bacterium]|nr:MAG: hypothetical protein DWQ33_13550 [Bacteroidota bacterium]REK05782.1 MAG: hypothetical protein DWQ39_05085 [Bacteroidota bacterium]REK31913.1 MAG: hypothetical protein DWQ44_13165 [Bacteroidota bacterium]REK49978.1 MAG: hypothetical protein DWQ48_05385 [Bacteroidota bacterium]